MFAISALIIGFLGSFHCVAMCGPIALAITGNSENNLKYLQNRSIYNFGRIITYAFLGVMVGLAGKIFLLAGFQKSVSITTGLIMIIIVLVSNYWPVKGNTNQITLYLSNWIKILFSVQLKSKSRSKFLFIGMANGILPCGFVYVALAGAAITQSPVDGAFYMALFGLGTFPAMMMVSILGKFAGMQFQSVLTRVSPVLMIILGLFFIYRGIMISENQSCHNPSISFHNNLEQVSCH